MRSLLLAGLLALASLLSLAAGGRAADLPNLLANPGFEDADASGWANGWTIWPAKPPEAGAVSLDSTVSHSGQRSLRLRQTNPGSYSRGQQRIVLEPHQRYAFTVWVKGEGLSPGDGSMRARMYVEGIGGQDHATEGMDGTFDWRELTVGPYDSGAGGPITVMCYLHQATGTAWFDDLRAFKVTPEWERELEQRRLRVGLESEVHLAEQAARVAADPQALAELQALRVRAGGLADAVSARPRRGPPYTPLEAEVFALMARLNARRLRPAPAVAAWRGEPFAALPPLGLVPAARPLGVALLALGDDREQATLNLCNLTGRPLRVRVGCRGFGGAPAPVVTLREAVHVETGPGTLVADPLPKLRAGGRLDLPPGVFRQLWCDVATAGCKPGTYRTEVRLSIPGHEPIAWPLELRVLPRKLPAMAPIATWSYSYQHWPLLKGRWPQARDDLVAHHINSYCWPSDTLPWPAFDSDGKLLPLDWSAFDRAVASHGPIQWLLLWPGFEWPANLALRQEGLQPGSPLWEERFTLWFRGLIAGLKQRGFGYDRVAWYLRDEPTTMPAAAVVALAGAAVHRADPRALVVANPYHAASRPVLERMAPAVDLWCPMLSWPQGELLQWFQEQSRHSGLLWTYQVLPKDCSAFGSYRLSFWDCWRKGISGHGFWDYADCPGDNWGPYPPNGAGYAVVYGGDPTELTPSRRWEAWREGTEDYTCLWLLKQAHPGSPLLGTRVAGLLARPTPETLQALRTEVLHELVRR